MGAAIEKAKKTQKKTKKRKKERKKEWKKEREKERKKERNLLKQHQWQLHWMSSNCIWDKCSYHCHYHGGQGTGPLDTLLLLPGILSHPLTLLPTLLPTQLSMHPPRKDCSDSPDPDRLGLGSNVWLPPKVDPSGQDNFSHIHSCVPTMECRDTRYTFEECLNKAAWCLQRVTIFISHWNHSNLEDRRIYFTWEIKKPRFRQVRWCFKRRWS